MMSDIPKREIQESKIYRSTEFLAQSRDRRMLSPQYSRLSRYSRFSFNYETQRVEELLREIGYWKKKYESLLGEYQLTENKQYIIELQNETEYWKSMYVQNDQVILLNEQVQFLQEQVNQLTDEIEFLNQARDRPQEILIQDQQQMYQPQELQSLQAGQMENQQIDPYVELESAHYTIHQLQEELDQYRNKSTNFDGIQRIAQLEQLLKQQNDEINELRMKLQTTLRASQLPRKSFNESNLVQDIQKLNKIIDEIERENQMLRDQLRQEMEKSKLVEIEKTKIISHFESRIVSMQTQSLSSGKETETIQRLLREREIRSEQLLELKRELEMLRSATIRTSGLELSAERLSYEAQIVSLQQRLDQVTRRLLNQETSSKQQEQFYEEEIAKLKQRVNESTQKLRESLINRSPDTFEVDKLNHELKEKIYELSITKQQYQEVMIKLQNLESQMIERYQSI